MIEFIKHQDFYKRMSFHKHPDRHHGDEARYDAAHAMQPYYVTYHGKDDYKTPETFFITKVGRERIWEYLGYDEENGKECYELTKRPKETYFGVIKITTREDGCWAISFIETRGDHRRKGIAKELLEELFKFLVRENVKRIWRSRPSPEGEKYTADYISKRLKEIGCEFEFY